MKQILVYSPSIIIPIIFNLILYFVFGNFIAPEYYGQYNFYVTLINFFYVLIGGMFINSLLRLQDDYKIMGESSKFVSTIFYSIILVFPFLLVIEFIINESIIISISYFPIY